VNAAGPSIAATRAAVAKAMKDSNRFELTALHRGYFFKTPLAATSRSFIRDENVPN